MKKLIIALSIAATVLATPALAETTTTATTDSTIPVTDSTISTTDSTISTTDSTVPSVDATTTTVDANPTSPTTNTNVPDAGLTPDSPFYFIDKLFEKIQLVLTSEENRAKLLEEFAQERLSEAQTVQDTSVKTELVNEYINTVNQVKEYIDKNIAAGNDMSTLLTNVKGGSTRGIEILQNLAKENNNQGLQNAINKQETKLAEHLIFADLKQQIHSNKEAIEALEEKIAEAKAAGQNVDDLEKQLAELKAKEELLKDTKKVLKKLKREAMVTYKIEEKDEDKNIDEENDKQIEENDKQIKEDDEDDKQVNEQDGDKKIEKKAHKSEQKIEREKEKEERKIEREKDREERKINKEKEKDDRKKNKEDQREEKGFDKSNSDESDDEN